MVGVDGSSLQMDSLHKLVGVFLGQQPPGTVSAFTK